MDKKQIYINYIILTLIGCSFAIGFATHCNHSIEPEANHTINIGFLGSFNYGLTLGKLIAGAIPLAVEEVNR